MRTQDDSVPIIYSLRVTTAASGNTFIVSVNASKPGTLFFATTRPPQAGPARIDQLLAPSTASGFNFSGSMAVPSAGVVAQRTLCVADGALLRLWAVLQDMEGSFEGRVPNNSTLTRCVGAT